MAKRPLLLCILDGFGWVPQETYGNAIAAAKTPYFDKLFASCPFTTIGASGMNVGLPDGQMGNSEVGHTNIGAGRIVYQELTRITKSIADGDFFENEALVSAMRSAKENGKALHLMGLLSDGGVHSHNGHLYGLLEMAKRMGLTRVYVHAIMDGRDVPPDSGLGFIKELQAKLASLGVGTIASVTGRYYAMDRDNRWDRVEKAYAAFVYGEGNHGTPGSDGKKLCRRRDGRICGARRDVRGRPCGRGRQRHLFQLPARPRPRNYPHLCGRRLHRLCAPLWAFSGALRVLHTV